MGDIYTGPERRSGKDRRQIQRSLFRKLFFPGQRSRSRRTEDRLRVTCLDRYGTKVFVLILLILGLSLMDAVLTLILLNRGAVELNPVMAFYIEQGPRAFLLVKYGLTVLSVIVLLVVKDAVSQRYRNGYLALPAVAAVFGSVVVWQLYLLSVPPA